MPAGLIILFMAAAIVALPFASCPMTPQQVDKWRRGITFWCLGLIALTGWSVLV